jgi:hypothetical protein
MKPDWDTLASEFADSAKVVVADVDCTGAGEPLCERFGVQGFPTIKSFSPPDTDGEDYEGGRSLDDLREFVTTLGPSCSAVSKENCDATQLAELDEVLKTPAAELAAELATLKKELDESESTHEALLKSLQSQYEESEKAKDELKKKLAPRVKLLRSATATAPAASSADTGKDEV